MTYLFQVLFFFKNCVFISADSIIVTVLSRSRAFLFAPMLEGPMLSSVINFNLFFYNNDVLSRKIHFLHCFSKSMFLI